MKDNQDKIIEVLNVEGGVVVMPTDTIYGIIGRACDRRAVEKIYKLKMRTLSKPLIVLISDISDLDKFSIHLAEVDRRILEKMWPGPFSVDLEMNTERFAYINKEKKLAVRIPDFDVLRDIIRHTGPLVAPSANLEGQSPATTILEAKKYFGGGVNLYVDNGEILEGEPSTLLSLKNGTIKVFRQGRGDLKLLNNGVSHYLL